jgi:cytochrome bd-type quinol oxidase subunit 1
MKISLHGLWEAFLDVMTGMGLVLLVLVAFGVLVLAYELVGNALWVLLIVALAAFLGFLVRIERRL